MERDRRITILNPDSQANATFYDTTVAMWNCHAPVNYCACVCVVEVFGAVWSVWIHSTVRASSRGHGLRQHESCQVSSWTRRIMRAVSTTCGCRLPVPSVGVEMEDHTTGVAWCDCCAWVTYKQSPSKGAHSLTVAAHERSRPAPIDRSISTVYCYCLLRDHGSQQCVPN